MDPSLADPNQGPMTSPVDATDTTTTPPGSRQPGTSGQPGTWSKLGWLLASLAMLLVVAGLWRFSPLHEVADAEAIGSWIRGLRHSPWALPIVLLIYVGANAVFFPNTVLNAATILGLGTVWGLPCALAGSLTAAMLAYGLGRRYGRDRLRDLDSKTIDRITEMLKRGGILGMASLRLLPIAPYGVVNILAGAARVRAHHFALGTLLGLLPGGLLVTAFGHQLRRVLEHPTPPQIAIMASVVLLALAAAWYLRRRALAS